MYNNQLVIGQIKELLRSFNLPIIPVQTDSTTIYPGRAYIKGSKIVRYDEDGTERVISDYKFGVEKLNTTKRLLNNSVNYDQYTHKYLGDYLRFVRDYTKVDLMCLYNCFNSEQLANTYKSLNNFEIDTANQNFIYYLVPVKLNQTYTVALESVLKYEYCLCLYNNSLVNSDFNNKLMQDTRVSKSGSSFKQPYLISTKLSSALANEIWRREKDLHLLIKLPTSVKSTITILEGVYNTSVVGSKVPSKLITDSDELEIPMLSKLSLLSVNNTHSRPFADRLVEYLFGHAITSQETISENIQMVQNLAYKDIGYIKGWSGVWDDQLKNTLVKQALGKDKINNLSKQQDITITASDVPWHNDKVIDTTINFNDHYKDLTGFADKDIISLIGGK